MAGQCREGLSHHGGASLSRGCVLPRLAVRSSAGLGVAAWKTLISKSLCRRESKQTWPRKYIQTNKSKKQPHPLQGTTNRLPCWVTHQCPHSLGPDACLLRLLWKQACYQGLCLGRDGTGEIWCPRQETHSSLSHRPFLKSGMAQCPGDLFPILGKSLFFQSCPGHCKMHGNMSNF